MMLQTNWSLSLSRRNLIGFCLAVFVSIFLIVFSISEADIAWHFTPNVDNLNGFANHGSGQPQGKLTYFGMLIFMQILFLAIFIFDFLRDRPSVRGGLKATFGITVFIFLGTVGESIKVSHAMEAAGCTPPSIVQVVNNII